MLSNTNNKRRLVIKSLGLSSLAGLLGYSLHRGIRYPGFGWETKPHHQSFNINGASITTQALIKLPKKLSGFRAYAPEPAININHALNEMALTVNNIAEDATLHVENATVKETINGITRQITLSPTQPKKTITLRWKLNNLTDYSFAAIGDTGGDKELAWCIQRAHQLNARFLLHLGDFHYTEGDYERAIELFNNAPLPCYVSIGNHDFHDNGRLVDQFLNNIGPLNYQFKIGDIRYINLDTAASFLPVSRGQRGQLMKQLTQDKTPYRDNVLFTHRPLVDPKPGRNHDLGNKKEHDWLIKGLQKTNIKTWLAGHIHILDQRDYMGINHIIAGQGLGYQDLIFDKDVSRIVIGKVSVNGPIRYDFAELKMPLKDHCHPRSQAWKDDNLHLPQVQENQRLCQSQGNKKA